MRVLTIADYMVLQGLRGELRTFYRDNLVAGFSEEEAQALHRGYFSSLPHLVPLGELWLKEIMAETKANGQQDPPPQN